MRVLAPSEVDGIHEPQCAEPEVHILLPPLLQLKSISERFTKLAVTSSATGKPGGSLQGGVAGPKLEVAANMHGEMRVGIKTDALRIESRWSGLSNPELDPSEVEGGEEGVKTHPSTRMREIEGEEGWAAVRVEGRDWGRVLGVGRLGGRVIACESRFRRGNLLADSHRLLPRQSSDTVCVSVERRRGCRGLCSDG